MQRIEQIVASDHLNFSQSPFMMKSFNQRRFRDTLLNKRHLKIGFFVIQNDHHIRSARCRSIDHFVFI